MPVRRPGRPDCCAGAHVAAARAPAPKQTVQALLRRVASGAAEERVFAAHELASLLETEESRYRGLVGDPHASPGLRAHYPIGKLLSAIKVRFHCCSRWPRGSCQLLRAAASLLHCPSAVAATQPLARNCYSSHAMVHRIIARLHTQAEMSQCVYHRHASPHPAG
jgi:hypothetical protein